MALHRIALVGLSVLGLTATTTIVLAQNTSNPLRSGNTTNPILERKYCDPTAPGSCFSGA